MSRKTGTKQGWKGRGKTEDDKKQNQKRRKGNKTLSKKNEKGWIKRKKYFDKKTIKEKEPKIKVLAHELLASTLSYLIPAPWWYSNPSKMNKTHAKFVTNTNAKHDYISTLPEQGDSTTSKCLKKWYKSFCI
jgi:hypothetical protein